MRSTDRCNYCGVGETLAHPLQECAGCNIVLYCSRGCQMDDWKKKEPNGKRHIQLCRIVKKYPRHSKTLKLVARHDDDKYIDFDAILNYAKEYMPCVEHFSISISQECVDYDDEETGPWDVKFSPECLSSFLESQLDNMLSFSYLMDDCCEKYTRRFTDGGMAFYPLARMTKLESLVTASALFGSADILQAILSSTSLQSSLKTLKLMTPVFGNLPKKWTTFEATTVAENVGRMKNLIKLGIEDSYLEPIQVRTMLSDLPHLRCLELSGQAGDFREVTVLRDTEFRFIAQACPELQQLDLSYHRSCTYEGVEAVLRECRNLREFRCSGIAIPGHRLAPLLRQQKKLLLFSVGDAGINSNTQRDIIMASGGRTLVMLGFGGLLKDGPGFSIPPSVEQEMARSKAFLDERFQLLKDDPCLHNEYEVLL